MGTILRSATLTDQPLSLPFASPRCPQLDCRFWSTLKSGEDRWRNPGCSAEAATAQWSTDYAGSLRTRRRWSAACRGRKSIGSHCEVRCEL